MKNRVAPQSRLVPYIFWETVYEFGAAQNVDTLTTLLAFTDFGSDFRALGIFLNNLDAVNPVTLVVDVSHDGTVPCVSRTQTRRIPALFQDVVEIGEPNPYTYARLAAHTDSPGFPTVSVQWAVVGLRR